MDALSLKTEGVLTNMGCLNLYKPINQGLGCVVRTCGYGLRGCCSLVDLNTEPNFWPLMGPNNKCGMCGLTKFIENSLFCSQ